MKFQIGIVCAEKKPSLFGCNIRINSPFSPYIYCFSKHLRHDKAECTLYTISLAVTFFVCEKVCRAAYIIMEIQLRFDLKKGSKYSAAATSNFMCIVFFI